jgi:hypothetical protein
VPPDSRKTSLDEIVASLLIKIFLAVTDEEVHDILHLGSNLSQFIQSTLSHNIILRLNVPLYTFSLEDVFFSLMLLHRNITSRATCNLTN